MTKFKVRYRSRSYIYVLAPQSIRKALYAREILELDVFLTDVVLVYYVGIRT